MTSMATPYTAADTRLRSVVVSWPERRIATWSFSPTRATRWPAKRCRKNPTGRRSMCCTKRVDIDSESFVESRISTTC